jgi:hypothetical protein
METLRDTLLRMLRQHLDRQNKPSNKPNNLETSDMNEFCNSEAACQILGCSIRSLVRYRKEGKLLENIHYGRNPGGRIILYNVGLLNHLISCGGDVNDRAHQVAIERYLADRPENQPKKAGRKKSNSSGRLNES